MTAATQPLYPSAKAVHSWSLFRTLGRFVAHGSMPSGDLPEGGGGGLDLLELPAQLARRGYRSVQLCHFYLPSRDPGYLNEVRIALTDAGVELECLLIDDGDLTVRAGPPTATTCSVSSASPCTATLRCGRATTRSGWSLPTMAAVSARAARRPSTSTACVSDAGQRRLRLRVKYIHRTGALGSDRSRCGRSRRRPADLRRGEVPGRGGDPVARDSSRTRRSSALCRIFAASSAETVESPGSNLSIKSARLITTASASWLQRTR